MSSTAPNPDPQFNTPKPEELQSEENRSATMKRVVERQGKETDVIDERKMQNNDAPDRSASPLEEMDELQNRHILSIDSPPG